MTYRPPQPPKWEIDFRFPTHERELDIGGPTLMWSEPEPVELEIKFRGETAILMKGSVLAPEGSLVLYQPDRWLQSFERDLNKANDEMGRADWIYDAELDVHIPVCRACRNGPLTGDQIVRGDCGQHGQEEG